MKFKTIFSTLLAALLLSTTVSAKEPGVAVFNVEQSVIKIALRDGISPQENHFFNTTCCTTLIHSRFSQRAWCRCIQRRAVCYQDCTTRRHLSTGCH